MEIAFFLFSSPVFHLAFCLELRVGDGLFVLSININFRRASGKEVV